MAFTFGFFTDAACTIPVTAVQFVQTTDALLATTNKSIYFGSANAARTLQAASSPGTAQIALSIPNPIPDLGFEANMLTLGLLEADLLTNVAGSPLNVGTQILGGSGNAIRIWLTIAQTLLTTGSYILSPISNDLVEF